MAPTPVGAPWMIAFLREQKRLGHDVAAIIPSREGSIAPILDAEGIKCYISPLDLMATTNPFKATGMLFDLVRLLRRLRPDVVQTHIFQAVLIGRLASWLADVPLRFSMNVGPLSMESPLLGPLESGTAWTDTRVIASCKYTRDLYLQAGVPAERLELIYYAIDQSGHDPALADGQRVRRELGIAPDQPTVGKIAYFYLPIQNPQVAPPHLVGLGLKGHEVLLRAIPRVLAAIPNTKFVIVGKGWGELGKAYEKSLHVLAETLGVAAAVIFTGERTDVPDTLACLDVSVHCSLTDNLGGTVESLLMAKPMVVSDIGGFADTVIHQKTGLRVPPGDSAALADSIIRLLRDRVLARQLGENGREWMLERFTLQRSIDDLEELYARTRSELKIGDALPRDRFFRLTRTIVRSCLLPFRVGPLALRARRSLIGPRASIPRRILRKAVWKMKAFVRGLLKPSATEQRSEGLKIAQVAGAWENCQWFVDLCRGLARKGHQVFAVIDVQQGDLGTRLAAAGIRYYTLPMTFGLKRDRSRVIVYAWQIPLSAIRLARILRRERVDIVHSHIFSSVVIARLAAALARTPRHVAMIPGPRHLEAPLTRTVDRLTWWLDDATVAGCRWTYELYRQLGANPQRLDSIYYGIDSAAFNPGTSSPNGVREELGISANAPVVTLVAHFYPPTLGFQTPQHTRGVGVKGHEHFLAAARIIALTLPEARFLLVGSGCNDEVGEAYRQRLMGECRADELLASRVIFTAKRSDIPAVLAASNVAVQCSLSENLGGTIEALLMERPTVATRVGGMPEAVHHEQTGLLVPPADPSALAAAILRLLSNREEAARFGAAGRRLMLERFTFDRMLADVEALYGRLMRSEGVVLLETV